jgi:dGTPase
VRKIKAAVVGDANCPEFKTIECSIMDVADDISYSTYDLEDAFKAGFLSPLSILAKDNQFKARVVSEVNRKVEAQYGSNPRD